MTGKRFHGYARKIATNVKDRTQLQSDLDLNNAEKKRIFNIYASFEMLAHDLAYHVSGQLNPGADSYHILDHDGHTRKYRAIRLMTPEQGLAGFVFVPDEKNNKNSRMHIIFKGTSDFYSAVRDLEHGGAGSESFREHQEFILQQINDHVRNLHTLTKRKIKLSISGHSLGGGDAQNCAASVIKAMAHNLDEDKGYSSYHQKFNKRVRENLCDIESIKIGHCNSAGVSHLTSQECKEDLEFLMYHSPDHKKPKISLHALRVKNDRIQETGQSNILYDISREYAKVDILHINMPEKWYSPANLLEFLAVMLMDSRMALASTINMASSALRTLNAHSSFHFVNKNNHEMSYHSNDSEYGRKLVHKHLTDKLELEDSKVGVFFKSALKKVLKMRS